MNRWWIGSMIIQDDHVHLLIQLQADDSVAEAVRILKGGTSRVIRKDFPELEEFLWGDSFWADGYFAESIGHVDERIIKKYILNCLIRCKCLIDLFGFYVSACAYCSHR